MGVRKVIVQIKDSKVIHIYDSINDVKHYGYSILSVNRCLKCRLKKTHKGYEWRYGFIW